MKRSLQKLAALNLALLLVLSLAMPALAAASLVKGQPITSRFPSDGVYNFDASAPGWYRVRADLTPIPNPPATYDTPASLSLYQNKDYVSAQEEGVSYGAGSKWESVFSESYFPGTGTGYYASFDSPLYRPTKVQLDYVSVTDDALVDELGSTGGTDKRYAVWNVTTPRLYQVYNGRAADSEGERLRTPAAVRAGTYYLQKNYWNEEDLLAVQVVTPAEISLGGSASEQLGCFHVTGLSPALKYTVTATPRGSQYAYINTMDVYNAEMEQIGGSGNIMQTETDSGKVFNFISQGDEAYFVLRGYFNSVDVTIKEASHSSIWLAASSGWSYRKTYGDAPFAGPSVRLSDGNGDPIDPTGKIRWSSTKPDIATVDPSTGEVTIHGTGSFYLVATEILEANSQLAPATASTYMYVEPAPITITVANQTITAGQTPKLTYTITSGSLKYGDDTDTLDELLEPDLRSVNLATNGTYTVSFDQINYEKYDITVVPGKLTVTGASSKVTYTPGTRAHLVMFLWRKAGSPAPKSTASFIDVNAKADYAKALSWAVENRIVAGMSDGRFNPDQRVTRAEMATILSRKEGMVEHEYEPEDGTVFADVGSDRWYYFYVYYACEHDLMEPVTETTFEPNAAITQDEITYACGKMGNGHSWGKATVTKQPTNIEEGVKTSTCSICDGEKTESIPAVPITVTMNWSKTAQTVTYTGSPAVITAPTVTLSKGTYSATTNNPITYTYAAAADGDYSEGLPTAAGVYYVKAAIAQQEGYTAGATAQPMKLTIGKAVPALGKVTINCAEKIYVGTAVNTANIPLESAEEPPAGALAYDAEQTLTVGTKDYKWTFTPNDTDNYETVTGTVAITAFADPIVAVTAKVYDSTGTTEKPEEVAVTVEGSTLKLVGKIPEDRVVKLTYQDEKGAASGTVTVAEDTTIALPGITYRLDLSGLKQIPENVEVAAAVVDANTIDPDTVDASAQTMAAGVNTALTDNSADSKVEGLTAAAAESVSQDGKVALEDKKTVDAAAAKAALEEKDIEVTDPTKVTTVLQPSLVLNVAAVTADSFTLDIKSVYNVIVTTAEDLSDPDAIKLDGVGANAVQVNKEPIEMVVTTPVTITVPLPAGFVGSSDKLFVKHEKKGKNGAVITYYYSAEVNEGNNTAKFTNPHGFSEFTFEKDSRKGKINFTDIGATVEYDLSNKGQALPAASASGKTFKGWSIAGTTYTTLTDALLDVISADADPKAASAVFVSKSTGDPTGTVGGEEEEEGFTCDGGSGCPGHAFSDVDPKEWYHEAVDYVLEKGLMKGEGEGKFNPTHSLTRSMLCQILYNKEKNPAVSGASSFADVKAGAWFKDAVVWATENKIVYGYSDSNKFGPEDPVTREQLAAILCRYADFKGESIAAAETALQSFSDINKADDWALTGLAWAVNNKIMFGKGNDKLDPLGKAQRCEVAAMVMRYLENGKD